MWRLCSKEDCDKQFFRGGSRAVTGWCPECVAARKAKAAARSTLKIRDDDEERIDTRLWNKQGNVVSEHKFKLRVCNFCKDEYRPYKKSDRYCTYCATKGIETFNSSKGIGNVGNKPCVVCGEEFFFKMRGSDKNGNFIPSNAQGKEGWCSIECKQMLRTRQDCKFCSTPIDSKQKITDEFCKRKWNEDENYDKKGATCATRYNHVERFRNPDMDYLLYPHNPSQRKVEILEEMGASWEIINEFRCEEE